MIFFAFFSPYAQLQLNFHQRMNKQSKYNVSKSYESANNYSAHVFGDENVDSILPMKVPLVHGDLIYFFPLKNIRNTGIVIAPNDIRDLKYQIKGQAINLWTEGKDGKHEFIVPQVLGIQLLESCGRIFKQYEGIIFYCNKKTK